MDPALVARIDRTAGIGGRSKFITEAVQEKLGITPGPKRTPAKGEVTPRLKK